MTTSKHEKPRATQRQIVARKQNKISALLAELLKKEELLYTTLRELKEDAEKQEIYTGFYTRLMTHSSDRQEELLLGIELIKNEANKCHFKRHREAYPFLKSQKIRKYEGVEE